ncbi:uncharacterized protein LOC144088492 [Stigmatopora argus]
MCLAATSVSASNVMLCQVEKIQLTHKQRALPTAALTLTRDHGSTKQGVVKKEARQCDRHSSSTVSRLQDNTKNCQLSPVLHQMQADAAAAGGQILTDLLEELADWPQEQLGQMHVDTAFIMPDALDNVEEEQEEKIGVQPNDGRRLGK